MPTSDHLAASAARGSSNTTDAADVDENYDQQLNVRFKRRRVNQARRLAASRGESIQEFFDRLVLAEVERERETLVKEFEEEEMRARQARQELLRELDTLTHS